MRPPVIVTSVLVLALAGLGTRIALAHCQVPCGIYDDPARVESMQENATSIRKAMTSMAELHTQATLESFNQATRWVEEKDRSATNIQETVSAYCLTQRVKPAAATSPEYATYIEQLEAFHHILVAAMKCKQQVSTETVDALDAAIARVAPWYSE